MYTWLAHFACSQFPFHISSRSWPSQNSSIILLVISNYLNHLFFAYYPTSGLLSQFKISVGEKKRENFVTIYSSRTIRNWKSLPFYFYQSHMLFLYLQKVILSQSLGNSFPQVFLQCTESFTQCNFQSSVLVLL